MGYTQSTDTHSLMASMVLAYLAALVANARNRDARAVAHSLYPARPRPVPANQSGTTSESTDTSNRKLEDEIRDREMVEEALRRSESRFKDFAELGADLFWEVDADLCYADAFGHYEEVLGLDPKSLLGRDREEIHAELVPDPAERSRYQQIFCNHEPFFNFRQSYVRADGKTVVLLTSARPIFNDQGEFRGYRGVARNITEAHLLSEQLKYQATHCPLTDLTNRRELEHRLRRALEQMRTDNSVHALCYLDLDQFKVVNDTCGHVAGDELLRQLATLFRGQIRDRDTLARLGGDEFGLFLEHCPMADAERIATKLRQTVDEFRFEWQGQSFNLGISIGLVPITAHSGDLSAIMSAADSACYAAKEAGRNRVHVFHDGDATLAKRHGEMRWVSRITAALEEDRFQICAQPIASISPITPARASVQLIQMKPDEELPPEANVASGCHMELLIRMIGEDGKIIPPGAFLGAAERYNLSPKLDRWMIRAGFRWLTQSPPRLERIELCAINLSGNSLGDDDFTAFVVDAFESTRIPPKKICFEITETAAISKLAAATRFMSTLKELGCRFALDDFGSGISSFGYLKRLPVDFLKIDGLFVKDMMDDPIDLAMVKSINEIGQVMGKKTIAEFVENDRIFAKLREIGVDYAQGYWVGRPKPIEEWLELTPCAGEPHAGANATQSMPVSSFAS